MVKMLDTGCSSKRSENLALSLTMNTTYISQRKKIIDKIQSYFGYFLVG